MKYINKAEHHYRDGIGDSDEDYDDDPRQEDSDDDDEVNDSEEDNKAYSNVHDSNDTVGYGDENEDDDYEDETKGHDDEDFSGQESEGNSEAEEKNKIFNLNLIKRQLNQQLEDKKDMILKYEEFKKEKIHETQAKNISEGIHPTSLDDAELDASPVKSEERQYNSSKENIEKIIEDIQRNQENTYVQCDGNTDVLLKHMKGYLPDQEKMLTNVYLSV